MHPDWARSLRDQCASAGVAFFFKQWGEWGSFEEEPFNKKLWGGRKDWELLTRDGSRDIPDGRFPSADLGEVGIVNIGKKYTGRLLDGVEHNGMPT